MTHKEQLVEEMMDKAFERMDRDAEAIHEDFLKDYDKRSRAFTDALREGCLKAITMQEEGHKGDVKYINITYLRTRVLTKDYSYRIDFLDKRWFLDTDECYSYWDNSSIYSYLDKVREDMLYQIDHRTLHDYDVDYMCQVLADFYNRMVYHQVKVFIEDAVACPEYEGMGKDSQLVITFGEYMDQSEVIHKEG